jgi:hypothetical protein
MRQNELIANARRRRPAAGGCARRADIRSLAVATVVGAPGLTLSQMASAGRPNDPRSVPLRRRAPRSVIRRMLESGKDAMRKRFMRLLLILASSIGGTPTFAQASPRRFTVMDACSGSDRNRSPSIVQCGGGRWRTAAAALSRRRCIRRRHAAAGLRRAAHRPTQAITGIAQASAVGSRGVAWRQDALTDFRSQRPSARHRFADSGGRSAIAVRHSCSSGSRKLDGSRSARSGRASAVGPSETSRSPACKGSGCQFARRGLLPIRPRFFEAGVGDGQCCSTWRKNETGRMPNSGGFHRPASIASAERS